MRIAVIGGGAMGSLYGGYLSKANDVVIVDVYEPLVDKVNRDGLVITEPDGSSAVYHPRMTTYTADMEPVDLIILFVKAMFSRAALENNRALIGRDTYIMTLQNGSGHEQVLSEFVDTDHVVIGTTQHNSAVVGLGEIRHGGSGITHVGCIAGNVNRLSPVVETLRTSGFEADCCENVQELIWNKMLNFRSTLLIGDSL